MLVVRLNLTMNLLFLKVFSVYLITFQLFQFAFKFPSFRQMNWLNPFPFFLTELGINPDHIFQKVISFLFDDNLIIFFPLHTAEANSCVKALSWIILQFISVDTDTFCTESSARDRRFHFTGHGFGRSIGVRPRLWRLLIARISPHFHYLLITRNQLLIYFFIFAVWQSSFQLHLRHRSVGLFGHLRPFKSDGVVRRFDRRHRLGPWLLPPTNGGPFGH